MDNKQINELISSWRNDALYMKNEEGYKILTLYMPKSFIEDVAFLLDRDNTFLDDLLMDAAYAYTIKNNLGDRYLEYELDDKLADDFINSWTNYSKNKDHTGLYEINLGIHMEELEMYLSLILELTKNNKIPKEYSPIEYLYLEFIETYKNIDVEEIKESEQEVLDELEKIYASNRRDN